MGLTTDAQNASAAERDADFWISIKQDKRAVLWSLLILTSIIMEGYNTALMPSFFAYTSFLKAYGQYFDNLDA